MFDSLSSFIMRQVVPHEHCTSLDTWVTSASEFSNLLVATSYFLIPLIFVKVAKARKDFKFDLTFWLFFLFNMSYGVCRLIIISSMWYNDTTIAALFRFLSASSSVGVVCVLWKLVPKLIIQPSSKTLEDVNTQLNIKVAELDDAISALEKARDEKEKAQATLLQSQKMDAIGQLTGGIAHDFNNLLFAISGNLELIKRDPSSDRAQRWLNSTLGAVEKASHLTGQLLTFSRVQKLQLNEVSIKSLFENLYDLITRTIGPEIHVVIDNIADVIVLTDKVQLELAILNLAINARDAMNDGGTLSIFTEVENHTLFINVKDTGSGISDEVVKKIFDPFFTTKDTGKGTGLGLSMVYGIAAQSHGDAYVKSTSPSGTTMTISIPIAESIPTTEIRTNSTDEILSNPVCNVLLVDDDVVVLQTLADVVSALGHHVTTYNNGPEALEYLKTCKPDIMLIDYAMPKMNGGAVVKAVKKIYKDIPIVFVTGYSQSAAILNYPVLKKPFTIKDIEKLFHDLFG